MLGIAAAANCIQNEFDGLPCSDTPAIKPNSSDSTQPTPVNKRVKQQHGSNGGDSPSPEAFESPARTQLLICLSVLTTEPVNTLRLSTSLASALDRYPERASDALEYFHPRKCYARKIHQGWLVHPCSQVWAKAIPLRQQTKLQRQELAQKYRVYLHIANCGKENY